MASSLTATKIKDTYGQLLHVDGGVNGTAKTVYDGDGTATALKISTAGIESTALTLSGGTANGVVYLNGSKVATTGSALTFDGSNFVVNPTNTQFYVGSSFAKIENKSGASASFVMADTTDSATIKNIGSSIVFLNSSTEQMRLTSTGLGIGTSSPSSKLDIVSDTGRLLNLSPTTSTYPVFQRMNNASGNFYIGIDSSSGGSFGEGNYSRVIYSDGAYPIVFTTNATERMRIDSSGNVGIGTSSPATKLHISSGGSSTALGITNSSGNAFVTAFGTDFIIDNLAGGSTIFRGSSYAERMRIDSSGNVGIGTSSPASKLDVVKAGNSAGGTMMLSGSKTNSTSKYGYLTGAHYTSDTYTQGVGIIGCTASSTDNNISIGGDVGEVLAATNIKFWTAANNTTGGGTERMRIDSSGNLLVGTTATIVSTVEGVQIGSNGTGQVLTRRNTTDPATQLAFFNPNGNVGSIVSSGTTISYVTSSDYRLKENIQPMQNALERNALLKPCTYSWKADGSTGEGFIAHELQAVCPDAVTGEKDAVDKDGNPVYQGVDTSFLVGHLVACIQELKAELDELKAKVG